MSLDWDLLYPLGKCCHSFVHALLIFSVKPWMYHMCLFKLLQKNLFWLFKLPLLDNRTKSTLGASSADEITALSWIKCTCVLCLSCQNCKRLSSGLENNKVVSLKVSVSSRALCGAGLCADYSKEQPGNMDVYRASLSKAFMDRHLCK